MLGIGFGGAVVNGAVSLKRKGATGDGTTDDTAAIQSALTAGAGGFVFIPKGVYKYTSNLVVPENTVLFGEGRGSVLYPIDAELQATSDNITLSNFAIVGTTASTIRVFADNITISKIHFETNGTELGQCVRLFTANNIQVLNCHFENTGYGVIQEGGYVSNNVLIDGNFINDAVNDFVEANCQDTTPSKNWTITNNIYQNGADYDNAITAEAGADYTTYRERRFVGITAVDNVIVSNNIVEKVAGDSAVHVEDIGTSLTICDNIFDNILGLGYINISSPSTTLDYNECIISGNTFRRTDSSSEVGNVLTVSSNRYVNEILFVNNRIVGDSSKNLKMDAQTQNFLKISHNMFRYCTTAIDAYNGKFINITNNVFRNCDTAVFAPSLQDSYILDNAVSDCTIGFDLGDGTQTNWNGALDVVVSGNTFRDIAGYNLISRRNSTGTNPPTRMLVSNNVFDQNTGTGTYAARITGNAATGATATQNVTFMGNVMLNGATYQITGDNLNLQSNIFNTDGTIDGLKGSALNIANQTAPSSASDTGTTGEIRFDTNYMYRCVATNTWKRVAISTW